jgi:hypothetical protein
MSLLSVGVLPVPRRAVLARGAAAESSTLTESALSTAIAAMQVCRHRAALPSCSPDRSARGLAPGGTRASEDIVGSRQSAESRRRSRRPSAGASMWLLLATSSDVTTWLEVAPFTTFSRQLRARRRGGASASHPGAAEAEARDRWPGGRWRRSPGPDAGRFSLRPTGRRALAEAVQAPAAPSVAKASRAPGRVRRGRSDRAGGAKPAIAFGNWDRPPMGAECCCHATGVEVPTMTPKRRSPR